MLFMTSLIFDKVVLTYIVSILGRFIEHKQKNWNWQIKALEIIIARSETTYTIAY
jgi:hypothetical protein